MSGRFLFARPLFLFSVTTFIAATIAFGGGIMDFDSDGIEDEFDNCPFDYNPDQTDSDFDGIGDDCDTCPFDADNDIDNDGVCGNEDNCPIDFNSDQTDSDFDDIGDACDTCPGDSNNDEDGDGICGDIDNCPALFNPGQEDVDNDGFGDVCDNCPGTFNPGQVDSDADGAGDDCDNCMIMFNPGQGDADLDGVGDDCDNCINFNPGQEDTDFDGFPDACDNCPTNNNGFQADLDSDGIGDICDDDDDGDGLPDAWEIMHGIHPADNGSGSITNGPNGDGDNDGASNLEEYIADTIPNSSSSVFRVSELTVNSPPIIAWSSSAARVYSIHYISELTNSAWSNLASGVTGVNELIYVTDTNAVDKRFYRLSVGFPP